MAWTTIPTVSAGQVIDPTAWGNKVVSASGEVQTELTLRKEQFISWTPASGTVQSSNNNDVWDDWITVSPAVTVPAGTSLVVATIAITAYADGAACVTMVKGTLDGVASSGYSGLTLWNSTARQQIVTQCSWSSPTAGARTLKVQTYRVTGGGGGRLTIDAGSSNLTASVRCYGAN